MSFVSSGLGEWISEDTSPIGPCPAYPSLLSDLGPSDQAALLVLFPGVVDKRESLRDVQWSCICNYLQHGRVFSPETKWKEKQDPHLMTALLLFSPKGITTLIAAFLGDFEVPLLLIAELMSFGGFENNLFSSFPTVKCYMLAFYSTHYEFTDREMTGISFHILSQFSQLTNACCNPAQSPCHRRGIQEAPFESSPSLAHRSPKPIPSSGPTPACNPHARLWWHKTQRNSGKVPTGIVPVQGLLLNEEGAKLWCLARHPWSSAFACLWSLGHSRAKREYQ